MIFNINNFTGKTQIETVPSTNGSLVYTGSEQSPTWIAYDPEQLTISGTTSATNAGTYTAAFTPNPNYEWSDGTAAAKTVTWTIAKAAGSLSISSSSGSVPTSDQTKSFTVTRAGDGNITVKSSDTSVATASISGTKVTVKSVAPFGSATITVSVAEGTNYTAPSAKTYTLSIQGYLIQDGVPFCEVIGVGKAPQSGYSAAPNVWTSQQDGYYQVYTSNSDYGMAYLEVPVDVTNANKMTITGTLTQSNPAYNGLRAWSKIGTYIGSNMVSEVQWADGATSASKDISGVTGKVYIGLGLKETVQKITSLRLT